MKLNRHRIPGPGEQTGLTQIAATLRQETVLRHTVLAVGERAHAPSPWLQLRRGLAPDRPHHRPERLKGLPLLFRPMGDEGCQQAVAVAVNAEHGQVDSRGHKPDAAGGHRPTGGDGPTHPMAQPQPSITPWPCIRPGRTEACIPPAILPGAAATGWRLNTNRMEPGVFSRNGPGSTCLPGACPQVRLDAVPHSSSSVNRTPLV